MISRTVDAERRRRRAIGWSALGDAEPDDGRDIDDPATTFGELLSCLRLAAGLSQNGLGREASVNASYVNRLERGERTTPTREVILALARALGATAAERDRLLWLTGYLPVRLQRLGATDSTVVACLLSLTDERLPEVAKDGFRSCIEALSTFWEYAALCPSTPMAARHAPAGPGQPQQSRVSLGSQADDD
jgi:transcriptional regulator with XRE-family HTH domain